MCCLSNSIKCKGQHRIEPIREKLIGCDITVKDDLKKKGFDLVNYYK